MLAGLGAHDASSLGPERPAASHPAEGGAARHTLDQGRLQVEVLATAAAKRADTQPPI